MDSARLSTLLQLEWRLLAAARTTWLIAAIAVVLEAAAIFNGSSTVEGRRQAFEEASHQQRSAFRAARQEIAAIEAKRAALGVPVPRLRKGLPSPVYVQPRLANFRAALPPLPTAVLSAGTSVVLPQRYAYRTGERFSPFIRTTGTRIVGGLFPERQTENPTSFLNGSFDLGFVTVFIWPVLILALTYNAVSSDREGGILNLVLAQPIRFHRWLLARMLVRAGFILSFVLLPAIAMCAIAGIDRSSDSLTRFGIWVIASAAYIVLWLLVGLIASICGSSAMMSSVIAISAWLGLVVIIPAGTHLILTGLFPPTTAITYADAERAASLAVNPRIDAATAALNRLVRMRSVAHPINADQDDPAFTYSVELPEAAELLESLIAVQPRWSRDMSTAQLSRALTEARRLLIEQKLAPVLVDISAQEKRLDSWIEIARYSSPALVFESVIDAIAGTDARRWRAFLSQIDEYVEQREEFFTRKILDRENVYSADFDRLTEYIFREESSGQLIERLAVPLIGLVGMSVILTAVLRFAVLHAHGAD